MIILNIIQKYFFYINKILNQKINPSFFFIKLLAKITF